MYDFSQFSECTILKKKVKTWPGCNDQCFKNVWELNYGFITPILVKFWWLYCRQKRSIVNNIAMQSPLNLQICMEKPFTHENLQNSLKCDRILMLDCKMTAGGMIFACQKCSNAVKWGRVNSGWATFCKLCNLDT